MRRKYEPPKAVLVEYRYDTNVVAKSTTCSTTIWRWQTESGCYEVKYTETPSRAAHPCDYIVDHPKFPY